MNNVSFILSIEFFIFSSKENEEELIINKIALFSQISFFHEKQNLELINFKMKFLRYGFQEKDNTMRKYINNHLVVITYFHDQFVKYGLEKTLSLNSACFYRTENGTKYTVSSNDFDKWSTNTACLPFSTVIVFDVLQCQINCLIQTQCKAVSFYQLFLNCMLFAYKSNTNETIFVDTNIVLLVVVDKTRTPTGQ